MALTPNDGNLLAVIASELRKAAEEEAQRILEEAEKQAQRIVEEAKARAEAVRAEKAKLRELERQRRLAPKLAELRAKFFSELYATVDKFVEGIVREAAEIVANNPEFRRMYVESALQEAFRSLHSQAVILEPCQGFEEVVKEAASSILATGRYPSVEVSFGKSRSCRCGFVARSADGRELFNATIEAKLREVKEQLMMYVWKKLKEEKIWLGLRSDR